MISFQKISEIVDPKQIWFIFKSEKQTNKQVIFKSEKQTKNQTKTKQNKNKNNNNKKKRTSASFLYTIYELE